jgi:hypothetical protein
LTTDADRSSFFVALVVVDVLVGLADAISGPYIVLFLVDEARLGPLALSATPAWGSSAAAAERPRARFMGSPRQLALYGFLIPTPANRYRKLTSA